MSIPLICVALLALLCIGLGFAVSLTRSGANTLYGSNIDPEDGLYKILRAHSNTTEYAPILALLIYILAQSQQPGWLIWCMVLATFFRYLFVVGIIVPTSMAKPNPLRFIGALGTYLTGFVLCGALLLQAING
jgi:uncharacterized membrane protein YecN with MAPEG domain